MTAPLCPNGCYKRKPLQWVDDQWYCPKCEDEFGDEVEANGRKRDRERLRLHVAYLRRQQGRRSLADALERLLDDEEWRVAVERGLCDYMKLPDDG